MGHHIKEWDVPDCPVCGTEMLSIMKYKDGSQTKDNPFGIKEYFWKCNQCGHIEEKEEGAF